MDRGTRRWRLAIAAFGQELRNARMSHGLGQAAVGTATGLSSAHVSRIERGLVQNLSLYQACRLASVVGLDLSIKAYPGGSPVRDAAHRSILDRARARLPAAGSWHYEVPLPIPDDPRAWDGLLEMVAGRTSFEAESHVSDIQALQRRLQLKQRDDPSIGAVVLVLADTRHNRGVMREYGEALRADFPLDREAIAASLAAGRVPAANGLMLV